ncbi:MAG: ammonium transporter, partial [Bacillota bacterium]|nr:ammonium transporter [Bacillota bacterium]
MTKLSNNNSGSRNVVFLIIILIAAIAMAIAFLPSVNSNVQESMDVINGSSTSIGSTEAHTIFDTLVYNRSIHILAMLLLGFGFLMVFVRGHGYSTITATLLVVSISVPVYMLIKSFVGEEPAVNIEALLWGEF